MSRRRPIKTRSRSRSSIRQRSTRARLHRAVAKLRSSTIALGLISAVSLLPNAVVDTLPEHGREAVMIATDIRNLALAIAFDTGSWATGLIAIVASSSLEQSLALIDRLSTRVPDRYLDVYRAIGEGRQCGHHE